MKGKKFIAIMAIFIILCSIQAITALEDNNMTQTDVQPTESNTLGISDVISSDIQSNESQVQNNDANDNARENNLEVSNSTSSSATVNSEILGVSNDNDLLGADPKSGHRPWAEWTPGTLVYGVDYDQNQAGNSEVPLKRFFQSIFWGIRDYISYNPSATNEWNVFLNNKTFTGNYGPDAIQTGYLSPQEDRVKYLTLNSLATSKGKRYDPDRPITIHLYGGSSIDDTNTSTLDLSGYSASYALIDFSMAGSSIKGINFKNFNASAHDATKDPSTTTPFIKLGDKSNPGNSIENLIQNCTFEGIVLNPKQPVCAVGEGVAKDLSFSKWQKESSLMELIKFIFRGVRDASKNGIRDFNVFLDNTTFTGGYGAAGVDTIKTGFYSWDNDGSHGRANYITFRNSDPNNPDTISYNRNLTVHIYGGWDKDSSDTSTIDLSEYGADYRFIDLSGGASTITGINFKNYDANKYDLDNSTSMPFIFLGDDKIQNYKSSLINCSFENITLYKKQPIVRMAYIDSPQDSSVISKAGGVIDGCVFRDNQASQMIAIAGSVADSSHSDNGPIFYGFEARNNLFENNKGTMEYNSNSSSLGLCMKIWNEAFNVTLNNNSFINNTNAVHGAAYCIIGFNATVTNNYFEGNEAVFGAGIEAHNGNITIKNCTFISNVAKGNHTQHPYRDGSGAGIALLGCNNYISNCTFVNNTAYGHAGAIDIVGGFKTKAGSEYYLVANNTTIENSRFFDNIAHYYAGGVHINGTNTRIDNCTFENNNASHAGAVKLIGENTTIINSSFTGNNAIQGGSCYLEGNYSTIVNSTFTNNNATHTLHGIKDNATMTSAGGALYIIGNYAEVSNNTFTGNTAVGKYSDGEGLGGAIYIHEEHIVFYKDNFKDNTASQGGAVYIYGNAVAANAMNFTGNKAIQGGAGFIKGNHIIINESEASFNTAMEGGALYIKGDDAKIIKSDFKNNTATKSISGIDTIGTKDIEADGGAISWIGHAGNIMESNFIYNTAEKGGAVSWTGLSGNITGSKFISNNATNGGALYIRNGSQSNKVSLKISDSNFKNNVALEDGGAINWNEGQDVNIAAEFVSNTANRGGAIFTNGIDGKIDSSILINNEAVQGGAAFINNDRLTVSNSDFDSNNAIEGGAAYIEGKNNLISESNFNYNNATYNLRLNTGTTDKKTKGGAIYIGGENNVIDHSKFEGNVANATNNTAVIVQTTPGLLGAYLDVNGVDDDGLGGAIFIGADNNNITSNEFGNNIARNGSAVYNDASGTYFKGGLFNKNQAWSYVLEVNGTNKTYCKDNIMNKIYYGANVEIKLYNYIAGDNILNGIYNAKGVTDVTFRDVGYIIDNDAGKIKTTLDNNINPALGAREGELYQDSLERYQPMVITVRCNETGEIVAKESVLTDLYGNYSFDLVGLNPGNYTIVAYHPEDMNYKYIITANTFEIIPIVDLSIKKAIDKDPIIVGNNAVFTITVSNAANATEATNVVIKEVLPNGLTVIDTNTSVGTYDSSSNTWNIDKLENGRQAKLVLTAKTSQVGLFNNSVNVSCDEKEWNYTNNNDTIEFDVISIVDLNIVKTVDDNDTEIGDVVTFTIDVTNKGPSNATNVVINDTLPDGLKWISGELNHVVPFLAKDETYRFTVVAQTTKIGSFTNHVNVTCAENDTVKSANATVNVYIIDLKIHKNANVSEAKINDLVNFTIVVRDHGNDESTNVRISDVLPQEFEFVSASGNYIRNHQNIVWIIDRLPAEQDYTVWIVARALYNGTFVNVAHVNCSEEPTVKNSTATVKVLKPVTLDITKVADDDDLSIGDDVTFTITVTNLGEENATNVVVEDILPDGLALSEGYSLKQTIALLRGGESVNITIKARATAKGAYTNVVSAYCNENTTRVFDNVTVNVYVVDLKIYKNANVSAAKINELVNFTIVVRDHGNNAALDVRLSDVLDESFEFVSASGDYVIKGQTVVWTVDRLPAEQDFIAWVVVRALTDGTFGNIAQANCSNEPTVKNSSTTTVKVLKPVTLDITKVANDDDFAIGNVVTFTITITNVGDENATFVVLKDVLPEGLTLVEGYLLEHIFPHLNGGESVNVTIKARTTATGAYTNVASVYCSENTTRVSDNTTIYVYEPDLKIQKTVNVTKTFINGMVNFTIVATNHGNSFATHVRISDVLPDGFEFVSASGNYNKDGQNIVWIIDNLPAYHDYTVWIVAKALTNGTFKNVARVNCSEEPTVKNSTANVTVYNPGFSVVKVALDDFVYSGNGTGFKIIITNYGDIELNNVFVEEMIPEGLIYDSFIGPNWIKNEDIFYYEHSLGVGESVELIVLVNTTISGNFTNNIVAGADNINNHIANATVTVYTPSLVVREISNIPKVILGSPVSFTVVVTNDGDCVLGDVYVSNVFPEGLIFTGFEGESWTKVGDRFVYSGVLNPGESVNYILYFNTTKSGTFIPEVIAGSNLTSNATSKAYSNNTTVVVSPGIAISKVANKNQVKVGELVSFTITVRNTGDVTLNDIFVIDELPDGLEFVSFNGNGWSKVGNTYYYSGSLAPGESISFIITCNATKAGSVTNVAIAGSDLTGNVSDNANVSIVKNVTPKPIDPVDPVEPVEPDEPVNQEESSHVPVDKKATGNPIIMLLLSIFAIVPLRRRKQ